MKKEPQTARLKITAFTKEGLGRGDVLSKDGKLKMVDTPFTMPEDEVEALLLKKRGGIYQSRLLEVLVPAKSRVEPRCRHFGHCGGCR